MEEHAEIPGKTLHQTATALRQGSGSILLPHSVSLAALRYRHGGGSSHPCSTLLAAGYTAILGSPCYPSLPRSHLRPDPYTVPVEIVRRQKRACEAEEGKNDEDDPARCKEKARTDPSLASGRYPALHGDMDPA